HACHSFLKIRSPNTPTTTPKWPKGAGQSGFYSLSLELSPSSSPDRSSPDDSSSDASSPDSSSRRSSSSLKPMDCISWLKSASACASPEAEVESGSLLTGREVCPGMKEVSE